MKKYPLNKLPFRIGTTSYIVPDEIIPNVRYLGELVDDIELVLFAVDDGPNNLPDESAIRELQLLSERFMLSYTVHLPLDLRLTGEDGGQHISLVKAKKVIECTRPLSPHAYVLHLDGRELLNNSTPQVQMDWKHQAIDSLRVVSRWMDDPRILTVENLENYPPSTWDEVIREAAVGRCIDIGHLWRDGQDPVDFLAAHICETRVIHIHGVAGRDHKSLANVAEPELERVFTFLIDVVYQGVVTIEVFSQEDFLSSMHALEKIVGN